MKLNSLLNTVLIAGTVFSLNSCINRYEPPRTDNTISSAKQDLTDAIADRASSKNYLVGTISHIDEESFLVAFSANHSAFAGNFSYEVISIKDSISDNISKLLVPHPTNYQKGEKVNLFYKPQDTISFKQIANKYLVGSKRLEVQKGKINIDGILLE